ncbi:GNAT family N-acetyltransferase [Pullulanibacillus sp. KACC 23026]|uniref:GNAT family N-acetyltransferase n=1 Tax=Pullulanibacillus sp. KACC 23026 TaxID=3028315 RepID=UPI0023AF6BA5|nr:GNAT family N-acetyltransferase [Pullulanibacillus sp. KACC 23026]WEG11695.1 GNAT family N-acetyltransferase [Pullulanibacillus sp. KACC 23026]
MIRELKPNEQNDYVELLKRLDQESHFWAIDSPSFFADSSDGTGRVNPIFGLVEEESLIGFVAIVRHSHEQIAHRAQLMIGILEKYHGRGYGRELINKAISYAKDQQIRRLEVTVMAPNKKALWLFGRAGFSVEGTRRKAVRVDQDYVDEFYMSLFL